MACSCGDGWPNRLCPGDIESGNVDIDDHPEDVGCSCCPECRRACGDMPGLEDDE